MRKTAVNQVHVLCLLLQKRCSGNASLSLKSRVETRGRSDPAYPSGRPTTLGECSQGSLLSWNNKILTPSQKDAPNDEALRGCFVCYTSGGSSTQSSGRCGFWKGFSSRVLRERTTFPSHNESVKWSWFKGRHPDHYWRAWSRVDDSTDRQCSSGVSLMHSSCIGSPPTGWV